ncbi:MAG: ATP-binding protein [Spirochaetaceae bacterium]|nr:ATP-binding protein [Spirochaetaceae bacterium]
MSLRAKFIILLILLNGMLIVFSFSFYFNNNRNIIIREEISIIDAVHRALYEENIAVRGMFILPISRQIGAMENAEKNLDRAISNLLSIRYLTDRSPVIDESVKNIIAARYNFLVSMSALLDIADKILTAVDRSIQPTANFEMILEYATEHNNEVLKVRARFFADLLFDIEKNIVSALANFDVQYKIIEEERSAIERNAVITFIIFFLGVAIISIIAGWFIARSIINVTHSLDKANKETDVIFNNIHEGIFQLDESLKIGHLCSKYFENLFGNIKFRNMAFLEFLREIEVSAKDIFVTEDYLKLFFNDKVNSTLLSQVNPLDKVFISIIDANGQKKERYLSFVFTIFVNADKKKELLGTVKDITEEVLYAEALKDEEEKNKEKMEQLLQIINIEPQVMDEFFEDSQDEIDYINNLLKSNRSDYRKVLSEIYLAVHSVKGNAQILGLTNIAEMLNKVENGIKELLDRAEISWEDILDSTIQLVHIQERINDLKERVEELQGYQIKLKNLEDKAGLFERTLHKVMATEGKKEGKILNLDYSNFDSREIPKDHRKIIKDIFVQLARNAISHGIEIPEEREKRGKNPQGKVSISLKKDREGNTLYSFRDDGNGIDVEKIGKIAQKKGLKKEGHDFDLSDAVKLIFNMGFSTAEENSLIAGRGVGLTFVREKINSVKGKIKIKTQPGKYCEYIIILPAQI